VELLWTGGLCQKIVLANLHFYQTNSPKLSKTFLTKNLTEKKKIGTTSENWTLKKPESSKNQTLQRTVFEWCW
jgi:hypothetical protein